MAIKYISKDEVQFLIKNNELMRKYYENNVFYKKVISYCKSNNYEDNGCVYVIEWMKSLKPTLEDKVWGQVSEERKIVGILNDKYHNHIYLRFNK